MDIFGKYASCQKLAVKINTTLSWVSAGIKQRESSHFSKRCIFHLFSKCLNCTGGLNSIHQKDNGLFWCFWRSLSAPNYFAEDTLKEFFFFKQHCGGGTPPTTTVPAENFKNGQKNVDTRQPDLLSMYSSVFVGKWCDPILSSICCLTTQYYRPLIFRRRRTTITGVHIHQCGTCFSHLFIHLHICLLTYQKQS